MTFDSEMHRLVCEIAYLGCVTNQAARARQVLEGLAVDRPDELDVVIGKALVSLTEGKPESAVAVLRPLSGSSDSRGVAFLALALKLAGRGSELDAVLESVVPGDASADALVAALRGAA